MGWLTGKLARSRRSGSESRLSGQDTRTDKTSAPPGAAKPASAADRDPAASLYDVALDLQDLFYRTRATGDLDRAIAAARKAANATPNGNPRRANRLSTLGNMLRTRFEHLGQQADMRATIAALEEAVALSVGHPDHGSHLDDLAVALRARSQRTASIADLDRAITLGREAAAITPGDHRHRAYVLSHLGNSLLARFNRTGDLRDLDQAIDAGREAVAAAKAEGYVERTNLGCALRDRFERTGNLADLDEAIDVHHEAVARVPVDHPDRCRCLSNLGAALRTRHDRTGDLADLRHAIAVLQEASEIVRDDHPNRPGILSNLGVALKTMFDCTGDFQLLERAVAAHRAAAEAVPHIGDLRERIFNNLAGALYVRYKNTGSLGDLDDAIEAGRQVRGANLVVALNSRFWRTGNLADLDEAITVGRDIVAADPIDLPARGLHLGMLGQALLNRYDRTDDPGVLEEAIAVDREAVAATPADHPDRAIRLENLGTALRDRFARTGDQASLNEAIDVERAALAAAPPGHNMIASLHATLAWSLLARFRSSGDTASLQESVQEFRAAVTATPGGHADRPGRLSNLGSGLHAQYRRLGRIDDLHEAISVLREAEAALPDGHSKRPAIQEKLGTALVSLYRKTREISTLNEALAIDRRALASTPRDGFSLGARLHSVSVDLWQRYIHTRSLDDLSDALKTARQAVQAEPADYPGRAGNLGLLGQILWEKHRRTKKDRYATEAIAAFREAAISESAVIAVRVSAASSWGQYAAALKDWEQAVEAYAMATNLLPMLAGSELGRSDQEHQLADETDLATDGAASAVNMKRPDLAVRLLEQGRGVLFSEALKTRSDITELQRLHAGIADEFLRLNRQLDAPTDIDPDERLTETPEKSDRPQARPDRHRLVEERDRLISEIRAIPGFDRFLLPPDPAQLLAAGEHGPVICCNVSSYRSDALIIDRGEIHVVNLPQVTPERVQSNVRHLLDASNEAGFASNKEEIIQAQRPMNDVLHWLWDALAHPVLDRLNITSAPGPGEPWPRIWWMPTGLLAFLPIHAAGYHTPNPALSSNRAPLTVIDRAISSYTPTIRALLHAREQAAIGVPPRALVVSMPGTPGDPLHLTGADDEARTVQSALPHSLLLREQEATTDRILAELPSFSWAHFACHAASDPDNPSRGQLLVHGYERRPLTVLDITHAHLNNTHLAFLSACETARTGLRLADESIHLASAFQLAGYAHVIGTLWPIKDAAAVRIAAHFYEQFSNPSPDDQNHDFATALHMAIRHTRESCRGIPSLWASHIHVGC